MDDSGRLHTRPCACTGETELQNERIKSASQTERQNLVEEKGNADSLRPRALRAGGAAEKWARQR